MSGKGGWASLHRGTRPGPTSGARAGTGESLLGTHAVLVAQLRGPSAFSQPWGGV